MDSSINSSTVPSTESENYTILPFNRDTFLSTYNRNQQWILPDSIIYYISKNASSAKVYGKLVQCCKYFMIRNPPVVVKDLRLTHRNNHMKIAFGLEPVDFNTVPSKIWITNELIVLTWFYSKEENYISILIPKICQSSIKKLNLLRQICFINDLKFLGSKCENIEFIDTLVMNKDGSVTAFEQVLQVFPHVTFIKFDFDVQSSQMITPTTATELIKIPHFSYFGFLRLFYIPETFNIEVFYAYMKKNKKTKFDLRFCNHLSDAYRNRLQAVVDEILAVDSHNYKVPVIYFANINPSAATSLVNLFCQS